jgi:membrane protease YdiL (CAAX protease family)
MDVIKFKRLGKCTLVIFLIKAIFAIIVFITSHLNILDLHKISESEISIKSYYGIIIGLILGIIIAPIIEEFAFRGWLTENNKVASISLIFFLFYLSLLTFNILVPNYGSSKYYFISALILIPSWFIWNNREAIASVVTIHISLLIPTSVLLFTAVHAFNYTIDISDWKSWVSLLILLLPYPPIGYILANIRMKSGLIWSISLHVITNSILLVRVLSGFDF